MDFKIDHIIEDIREYIEVYIVNEDSVKNNSRGAIYKKLSSVITNLYASDQAIIYTKLKDVEHKLFLQEFILSVNEDILLFLETHHLYEFLNIIGLEKFTYFVITLEFEQMVEVLERFDEDKRGEIMALMPFKKRIQLKRSLSYPEYSCGRNMSVDYLSTPYWWTIARTKKYIKDSKTAIKNEEGTIFITDEERKIVGSVSIIKLLNEDPSHLMSSCTDENVITVKVYDSIPDISHLFDEHNLDVIPVTNKNGHLVGILDIAEVVEYLHESSENQILRSVGIFETKSNTIFGIAKPRFLWLIVDFLTAVFASFFISLFEDSIAKVTTLAVLMPIISTMGGNCGSQTSTVIIRAIFVGNIARRQIFNEILVGLANGIGLSIFCFLCVWLFFANLILGIIFGVSILITLFIAGVAGVLIPLTLKRLKIDPAVATSICLTTITDISGFVTILLLGTIFIVGGNH